MNSFCERLKEERTRLGFSQADFAQIAGVQRRAQVNYEAGERAPDSDYLEKASLVGVDVGYLITGHRTVLEERRFTWKEVEEAGHGMLSDGGVIGAITIDSKQTYEFLLSLLMRNLTKVTGVQAPVEQTSASLSKKTG
jgi:transcriptional regulator with XRE-family HTH domain